MSRRGRGRGRGRDRGNSSDFLWVNRTPASDSLSATRQERGELQTITSHARQWRAALRRQQRLSNAQTEATRAQSIVGWGRPGPPETSSGETSGAPSPIALTQATGNSTDPFTYLESSEDAWWSRSAFQFAVTSWLPVIFRTADIWDEALTSMESTTSIIDRIVRGCLGNTMHMSSLLAASSGFMKFVLKLQLDRQDTPEFCMDKALRHLRYHLASNDPEVDQSLVFDLSALSSFERYVQNYEGAQTHLRMDQHLVVSMGGSDALEPPLRFLCWLWDLLVAGGAGETPLMSLTWDPGLLGRLEMDHEVLPDLVRRGIAASDSRLLDYCSMVQDDLATIIGDVVQWFQVQQYLQIQRSARPFIKQWAGRRSHAFVHRLLSISTTTADDDMQGLFSESLKQTVLMVIADFEALRRSQSEADSIRDPTVFSWSNVHRLREALSRLEFLGEDWRIQNQYLLLWMTCVGVQHLARPVTRPTTTSMNPSGSDEDDLSDWFVQLAKKILSDRQRRESPSDPDQLQILTQVMRRYLHRCDPLGEPDMHGLEDVLEL